MGLVKITLFGLFSSFVALPLVAQETTTTNATTEVGEVNYNKLPEEYWPKSSQVKKKNQDQLDAYINGDTLYSPRLKRQMAIGIAGGLGTLSGDVRSVGGFGTSVFFRHNISYILSARYEFGFYRTWGQNYEAKTLRGDLQNPNTAYRNKAYRGANDYRAAGVNYAYDNYKTDIVDLQASVLLNLTNLLLMHRKQTRFNLYVHAGGGVMNYKTWIDALDDDGNVYDYNTIRNEVNKLNTAHERGKLFASKDRREVRNYLYDNVYNSRPRGRSYETMAEGHKEGNLFGRVANFVFSGGLGVEALLGKKDRVSIGLEHRVTFTGDDLLDGQQWSEQGDLTREFDTYHYVSAKLSFFLGKKDKRAIPMWWDNPTATYLRKYEAPGDHFKDSDNDGIDDFYDLEANTKPDCPVDSKGRLLDSDGDGCPDCEDPEPFSSPLLPIVDCKNVYDGFASKECCDEKAMGSGTSAVFPVVAFAPDRFGVNKDQMAELDQIAKMMQENPDAKVVITGISRSTKNIKYNEQLAWLRANETVDYLVEKYGISRDRFIVEYQGENIKSEGGDFDKFQNNRVEFRYAEEGESGSSNPPAPHPGYKAGRN